MAPPGLTALFVSAGLAPHAPTATLPPTTVLVPSEEVPLEEVTVPLPTFTGAADGVVLFELEDEDEEEPSVPFEEEPGEDEETTVPFEDEPGEDEETTVPFEEELEDEGLEEDDDDETLVPFEEELDDEGLEDEEPEEEEDEPLEAMELASAGLTMVEEETVLLPVLRASWPRTSGEESMKSKAGPATWLPRNWSTTLLSSGCDELVR